MSGTTWTKFFWSDWQSDPALRLCSYAARGLWMDMLCIAAAHDPIGYVAVAGRSLTETDIARMTGGSESEVSSLLGELDRNGVFSRDRHGRIYSRRMIVDARRAAEAKKFGKKGGNPSLRKTEENSRGVNPPDKGPDKPHKPEASIQKEFEDADASSAEIRPKRPSSLKADPQLVERLWAYQPVCGGKRKATRPEVTKALDSALKRGGDPAEIEAAFRAYYALPDCTRDGGQYAKGAAVLLNDDKWRDFAPSSPAAPLGLDWPETRWAAAVTIWRADGAWHEDLGPTPGQPGCRVPAHVLTQPATGATA